MAASSSSSSSPSTSTSTPAAASGSESNGEDVVRARLEADRRELLDLSLRNPLLNYRPRSRGLEFLGESAGQVFHVLAGQGKRLKFLTAPNQDSAEVADERVLDPGAANELSPSLGTSALQTDLKLQTDLTAEELQARLLAIFHAARMSIEEQGVNTLFLVPGMLRWYERDDRERKRPLRAPLVLVPVELERSSAREQFRLRAREEDPDVNLSLVAKLRADFAIELPEFPGGDGDPDAPDAAERFLDSVAASVRDQEGWEVDRGGVVLGFFSFGKFLMYRDLDEASWPAEARPCDHPIVRALLGDGFPETPRAEGDEGPLDAILAPAERNLVVDADSTQQLAIVDVSLGRNLLIQGPPGTGKSQTITNLIADAIGQGKTVLFVAEKLAALEVVKRRLDAIGLGDACLELHSQKTSKRATLDELRRTLGLGRPRIEPIDDERALRDASRDRLSAYCEAVNTPIGSSAITPFQAYGALLHLQDLRFETEPACMELPAIAGWTGYDLKRRRSLVAELQARLADVGCPSMHPFWGCRRTKLLPTEVSQLRGLLRTARQVMAELRQGAERLAGLLRLPAVASRAEAAQLLRAARRAAKAVQLSGVDTASGEWITARDQLRALLEAGQTLERIQKHYESVLLPEAWDQDLRETRQTLNGTGRQWWHWLAPSYQRARRTLAGLCRGAPPVKLEDQLALIDSLLEAQRLREAITRQETVGARLFGPRWHGSRSHWTALAKLAHWTWRLHDDVHAGRLPEGILAYLAENRKAAPLTAAAEDLKQALTAHQTHLDAVARFLEDDATLRSGTGAGETLAQLPFRVVEGLLQTWTDRTAELPLMVGFNQLAGRCRDEGLGAVVTLAEVWPEAADHLGDVFERRLHEELLTEAFTRRPALAEFDGRGQEHAVATFCDLDRLVLRHTRVRLALEHWQRLPRHEGGGQLGVLRREFEKKTRHLPLRGLLGRAGNAVRAIKPVFLMSPLSIASYLAPGAPLFDLVIFDEASQVRPVDALGALLRGRQAVVVGDSRQLPPTSFFDRLTGGDIEPDDDESISSGDVESVLGLFAAMGAPQRMLRWHYRSRHESLIAVANREFYDGRLIVFPSPDAARSERGLILRHLPDAVYDRGGTRTNPTEALAVAEAVMAHARSQLARSVEERLTIGVAAFSMAQRQAIQDHLERLRRDEPACEPYFASGGPEPFFVKNLETVQGDERDVIYISVGYGRTSDGLLAMSFGPLNGEGGERRLNVLITRARVRCEVFSSLRADDIDLNRTSARGVRALKAFLAYAQERPLAGEDGLTARPEAERSSEFVEAVAETLTAAGVAVGRPARSEPLAFDLSISDQTEAGRARMALACDGPTYQAARSTRDRDRLRPQILESLGWRVRQVWSTEWVRSPEAERRRLLAGLQEPAVPPVRPTALAIPSERLDSSVERPLEGPEEAAASAAAPVAQEPFERENGPPSDPVAPPGPAYQLARLPVSLDGLDLAGLPLKRLMAMVTQVVAVESPVHRDEVVRRIADAAGVKRLGSRVQTALETACDQAVRQGVIDRQGDFLWQSGSPEPAVRDRGSLPLVSRKLELVAPEEVTRAIETVVRASFGIDPEALPGAVGRLLGFGRVGDEFRERVRTLTQSAIDSGRLAREGAQVVAPPRPPAADVPSGTQDDEPSRPAP